MATRKNSGNVNPEALFNAYKKANDELADIKVRQEAALAERTKHVKVIFDAFGKGPFEFDGQTVTIVKRDTKDEQGVVTGTTWFFKSIGDEVMKIGK